jgi:hypothetical protein
MRETEISSVMRSPGCRFAHSVIVLKVKPGTGGKGNVSTVAIVTPTISDC